MKKYVAIVLQALVNLGVSLSLVDSLHSHSLFWQIVSVWAVLNLFWYYLAK